MWDDFLVADGHLRGVSETVKLVSFFLFWFIVAGMWKLFCSVQRN